MSCCAPTSGSAPITFEKYNEKKADQRTKMIVAVALISIALILMGLSRIGTGLGYMPATRMTGFAFIYQFASMHVFFLGAALGVVGLGYGVAAAIQAREIKNATYTKLEVS